MQATAHHREHGPNYDAESLVRSASAAAARMRDALASYYPELRPADERRWEFLVTAAGLYLASGSTELTRTDRQALPDHLVQAMDSCRHFVDRAGRGATDAITSDWAIGYWVLSGLFRREPAADQAWLAAAIGETLRRTSATLAESTRLQPTSSQTHLPERSRQKAAG